jgi:SAM-dependent methyltransferase
VQEAEPTIRLPPDGVALDQDQEWCEIAVDGGWRRIRFHEYGEIYAVPGLYERLFHDLLRCSSPETVVGLLADQVAREDGGLPELSVLDLGAGNGLVGEALRAAGARDIVGVDIVPEAGDAVGRDRPGVYAAYHVCDLLDPPAHVADELRHARFDVLTSVAALGFGDIPPAVFRAALDLVRGGGWVAFTLKEDFLGDGEPSGFAALIGELERSGALKIRARHRYLHRLSVAGLPLHYVAMVARLPDTPRPA